MSKTNLGGNDSSSSSGDDLASQNRGSVTKFPIVNITNANDSASSSNVSERVKQLLESLENFDSLYICPINKPLPAEVTRSIHRNCVQKYEIKDYFGVTCFYAAELTSCLSYYFCSNSRNFEIFMYSLTGEVLFESVRTCSASLCLWGVDCCCVGGVETTANFKKAENYIGSVHSTGTCTTPKFTVRNQFADDTYCITGPKNSLICPCKLCFANEFPITIANTDQSVGKIIYGYDGLLEHRITNPKTVGVIFPPRCSTESKACLLTAGFMLDVTYYQKRGCTAHRTLRHFFHLCVFAGIGYGIYQLYRVIEDNVG